MTNRNPIRQVFITWPKTPVSAEDLLKILIETFSLTATEIATEKHQDGTDHLHAVVQFSNTYSVSHILKQFKDKFPEDNQRLHVRPIRSLNHSLAYIRKEDPNPVSQGTFENSRAETLQRSLWHKKMQNLFRHYASFYSESNDPEEATAMYLSDLSSEYSKTFSDLDSYYSFLLECRSAGLTPKEFISVA